MTDHSGFKALGDIDMNGNIIHKVGKLSGSQIFVTTISGGNVTSGVNPGHTHTSGSIIEDVKTYYVSIPGAAFQTKYEGNASEDHVTRIATASGNSIQGNHANWDTVAAVHVPHDSTLTGVTMFSSSGSAVFSLRRGTVSGTAADFPFSGQLNNTEITSISNPVVDNKNYNYVLLEGTLNTDDQIFGAVVKYTK